MKTLILALVATLTLPAFAAAEEPTSDEICNVLARYAESIMTIRQHGGSLAVALTTTDGVPSLRGLVLAAYDEPRFGTADFQARAISDFRDSVHLSCLKLE